MRIYANLLVLIVVFLLIEAIHRISVFLILPSCLRIIFSFANSEMEKNLLLSQKVKISLIKSALPEGQAGVLGASSLIKV